jgi:gas vesicle protein
MPERKIEVQNSGGSWFSGFIMGALVGAAIALLTTRRTGEETREMLTTRGQKVMDRAMDYKDKAADTVSSARDKAQNLADEAKKRVSRTADQVRNKTSDMAETMQQKGSSMAESAQQQIPHTGEMKDEMTELQRENEILQEDRDKNYDL